MTKPMPPCTVDGCDKPQQARGWCAMHYGRNRRNGVLHTVYRETERVIRCRIEGCGEPAETHRLCPMHYSRWRRGSDKLNVPNKLTGGTPVERVLRRCTPAGGHLLWDRPDALPLLRTAQTSLSVRRILWADAHGDIDAGANVIRTCDVPNCVAVEHMSTAR